MPRLFAVLLGGQAPGSNTELHDVVFVTGDRLEDTYPALLMKWFGAAEGLHVDSYRVLDVVDGHRVELTREGPASGPRLFFVNLGGYRDGEFAEAHANTFVVAQDVDTAKRRAKASLLQGYDAVHTDDLYDVDACLELDAVDGWRVALVPASADARERPPVNGYHPLPAHEIAAHRTRGSAEGV